MPGIGLGASLRARIGVWLSGGSTPGLPGGDTGGVIVANAVSRSTSSGAYTFMVSRTGDTSGPKTATVQVGPSSLPGRMPAVPADFGGTFPSGLIAWAAGDAAPKTFTVTPSTNALPE